MWSQRRTPSDNWNSWTLKDIKACTPDKNNLLATLPDEMSRDQVEVLFGVDAFMLSCWACLFHGVKEENIDVAKEASVKLQQLILELTRSHVSSKRVAGPKQCVCR